MLATGHKTETSFNRYLGIDEQELLRHFHKTARRVADCLRRWPELAAPLSALPSKPAQQGTLARRSGGLGGPVQTAPIRVSRKYPKKVPLRAGNATFKILQ